MYSTAYQSLVGSCEGKLLFVIFYSVKTGFSVVVHLVIIQTTQIWSVLVDWHNPMEQHDAYLLSIALSVHSYDHFIVIT